MRIQKLEKLTPYLKRVGESVPQLKKAGKIAATTIAGVSLIAAPVGCVTVKKAQAEKNTADTVEISSKTVEAENNSNMKKKTGYFVGGTSALALGTGLALASTNPVGWAVAGCAGVLGIYGVTKGYFMDNDAE